MPTTKERCEYCGTIEHCYDCSLCGHTFCHAHRIPEDHECEELVLEDVDEEV